MVDEVYNLPSLDDYLKDSGTDYGDWVRLMFDLFVDQYYGPEFDVGDREFMPEEVAELKELLDMLKAGEEVDLEYIKENYPKFYEYIESNYDLTPAPEETEVTAPADDRTDWQKNKDYIIEQVESGNAS